MLSCKWLSHCRCHIFRILGCKVKYVSSLLFWHDGLYYCQWIILFHANTAQTFTFSKLSMKLWMTISYESLKVDKKQKDYWLILHYLISHISWPNGLKWHKHRKKESKNSSLQIYNPFVYNVSLAYTFQLLYSPSIYNFQRTDFPQEQEIQKTQVGISIEEYIQRNLLDSVVTSV